MAPKSATPKAPPMERKKFDAAVAVPRFSYETLFCTER